MPSCKSRVTLTSLIGHHHHLGGGALALGVEDLQGQGVLGVGGQVPQDVLPQAGILDHNTLPGTSSPAQAAPAPPWQTSALVRKFVSEKFSINC